MTAAFSIDPVARREVAGLDPLDVVGGQGREEHDPDDRDDPGDRPLLARKMLISDATRMPDQRHEQDPADAPPASAW